MLHVDRVRSTITLNENQFHSVGRNRIQIDGAGVITHRIFYSLRLRARQIACESAWRRHACMNLGTYGVRCLSWFMVMRHSVIFLSIAVCGGLRQLITCETETFSCGQSTLGSRAIAIEVQTRVQPKNRKVIIFCDESSFIWPQTFQPALALFIERMYRGRSISPWKMKQGIIFPANS